MPIIMEEIYSSLLVEHPSASNRSFTESEPESSDDADNTYRTPELIPSPIMKQQSLPVAAIFAEPRAHDPRTCAICGVKTENFCTSCSGVFYCSDTHRRQDEHVHKFICNAVKEMPPRPKGDGWICILVMPEYEPHPYFQWTQTYLNKYNVPSFDQSQWFGKNYQSVPGFITHHPVTRGALGNPIIYFRKQTCENKKPSDVNICVHNLTDGVNSESHQGSMVFVSSFRATTGREWFLSFLPGYLSYAIEHLKHPRSGVLLAEKFESVRGLCIRPWRDPNSGKETIRLDRTNIPAKHPIFNDSDNRVAISPIGAGYNFNIRGFFYEDENALMLKGNTIASDLFREIEQTKISIKMKSPTFLASDIGGILVVRADLKPLEPEHIELLVEFIKYLEKLWDDYADFDAKNPVMQRPNTGKEFEQEVAITKMYIGSLDPVAFMKYWDKNSANSACPSSFDQVAYSSSMYETDSDLSGYRAYRHEIANSESLLD